MPDISPVEASVINPIERLTSKSDDVDVLVGVDEGIFVSLGIPEKDNVIEIPDKPYVFVADELRVRDENHSDGLLLENTPLIMAHGVRNDKDEWVFLNGQSIPETVKAYNQYAGKEGLPTLEFVVVCNKDSITEDSGIRVYEPNIPDNVAYAVGEELVVNTVMESDGKSRIYVTAQGSIANLDTVKTANDITLIE